MTNPIRYGKFFGSTTFDTLIVHEIIGDTKILVGRLISGPGIRRDTIINADLTGNGGPGLYGIPPQFFAVSSSIMTVEYLEKKQKPLPPAPPGFIRAAGQQFRKEDSPLFNPAISVTSGRPSRTELIDLVSAHFKVSVSVARDWLTNEFGGRQ